MKSANGWPADAMNVHDAMVAHAMEIGAGVSKNSSPAFLFIACSEGLDPKEVLKEARTLFPKTKNIQCTTSCQGVTTDSGFIKAEAGEGAVSRTSTGRSNVGLPTYALGVLAVFDPLGSYVTFGMPAIDGSTSTPATMHQAFDRAYMKLRETALDVLRDPNNDTNVTPADEPLAQTMTIWMAGMPGTEEVALDTIYEWAHSRFNRTVPIVGGSSADASIAGKWRTFALQGDGTECIYGQEAGQGLTFTMIASCVKCFPLFMHPYTPITKCTAKVLSVGSGEHDKGEAMGRVIYQVLICRSGEPFVVNSSVPEVLFWVYCGFLAQQEGTASC